MWIEPKSEKVDGFVPPRWEIEPIPTDSKEARAYVAELNRQLAKAGYTGYERIPDQVRVRAAIAARRIIDAQKIEHARRIIERLYAEAQADVQQRLSIIAASPACSDLMARVSLRETPGPALPPSAATTLAAAPDASQRTPEIPKWITSPTRRPGPPKSTERIRP